MNAESGPVVRIAMWSGPRNISTAMMRAFENRADCAVVDEPLYGYYLKTSGAEHPGAADIIAAMDCDWRSVAVSLVEDTPAPCRVFYQKHMSQHLLPEVEFDFTRQLVNCFLLREPERVIASYARVRPDFDLAEIGFSQQLALFRYLREQTGRAPLVLEANEVLADPRRALEGLCRYAGIAFDEAMLAWPAGPRDSDGVWAPYWYDAVLASTGFQGPDTRAIELPLRYRQLASAARQIYQELMQYGSAQRQAG